MSEIDAARLEIRERIEKRIRGLDLNYHMGIQRGIWEILDDELSPFLARPAPSQSDEDGRLSYDELWKLAIHHQGRADELAAQLITIRAEATLAGAAAEREACAKVIEDHSILFCGGGPNELKKRIGGDITGLTYAAAIRARKP